MGQRILFFSEEQEKQNIGGSKARQDIDYILRQRGYTPINSRMCRDFSSPKNVINSLLSIRINWKRYKKIAQDADILIIQYPFGDYKTNIYEIKKMKDKKDISVIAIIHDLPSIQEGTIDKSLEITLLKEMSMIICHNKKMAEVLVKLGINKNRLVCLEIFDYLCDNVDKRKSKDDGITIAGNMSPVKAKYIYKLIDEYQNKDLIIHLYGPNFENNSFKGYHGSLTPEELIRQIRGSYGLIWDGDSLEECNGLFGNYQKINNPHRVSMNLAAKMPILIWRKAALSEYVEENKVGLVIDSLTDIDILLQNITMEKYQEMQKNLEIISDKIRNGHYTNKAIDNALKKLGELK